MAGGIALAACGNSGDDGSGGGDASDAGVSLAEAGSACSTDLASDLHHCGDCLTDCTTLPHVNGAAVSCAQGACVTTGACAAGYADCSAKQAGCETALDTTEDCGACGVTCSGSTPVCSAGACAAGCPGVFPDVCNGSCTDVQTDAKNCGGCGTVCAGDGGPSEGVCVAGTCQSACHAGYNACAGACVPDDDVAACGASCTVCPGAALSTAVCQDGKCALICNSGAHSCGGTCVDDHLLTSCGATSCAPCPVPAGAIATCDGTSCGFTCTAGFADCDGQAANGCEANLDDDSYNCGTCGRDCMRGTCSAGACQPWEMATEQTPINFSAPATGATGGWYEAASNGINYTAYAGGGLGYGGSFLDVAANGEVVFWSSAAATLGWGDVGLTNVQPIPVPAGHAPTSLALSGIGFAWTDSAGNLLNYDPSTNAVVTVAPSAYGSPGTCAFSLNTARDVFFEMANGYVFRWDGEHPNAVSLLVQVPPGSAAIASDDTYLYLGGSNGDVYKLTAAGGPMTTLTTRSAPVAALALDGGALYILTDVGLDRYDLTTGQIASLGAVGAGGARCHSLAVLPAQFLFSGRVGGAYGIYGLAR